MYALYGNIFSIASLNRKLLLTPPQVVRPAIASRLVGVTAVKPLDTRYFLEMIFPRRRTT